VWFPFWYQFIQVDLEYRLLNEDDDESPNFIEDITASNKQQLVHDYKIVCQSNSLPVQCFVNKEESATANRTRITIHLRQTV